MRVTDMSDELYYRALGPLAVARGSRPVELGGPQRQLVLAVLLAHVNHPVSTDVLVDALWTGPPPRSYRVQVQGLVSDLRRRLTGGVDRAAAPIVTTTGGYRLETAPEHFDVEQFRSEVVAGRRARVLADDAATVRILRTALDRWHGPAFAGILTPVVRERAAEVDELRAAAWETYVDAGLADGRAAEMIPVLTAAIAEHAFRERFRAQLMRAYVATGRTADALAAYRRYRRLVVAELGIEPSFELQRLHRSVLAADLDVATARPGPEPDAATPVSAYQQLPADLPTFTGRRSPLATILGLARRPAGTGPAVVVIDGMGGVGKTALAVRAAHQLVAYGLYPDAQLYVDLRGFSPEQNPVDPGVALESLLRLLGVPPGRIPDSLAERSAVLRDRLSRLSALLLLDNAADEAQVTPLLPGGDRCLVLVTSRRRLAIDVARPVRLGALPVAESMRLLASVVGADRVAADIGASRELLNRCGHLPLAVAIVAQRLRARPAWSIAYLAGRLADHDGTLSELAMRAVSVERVLSLSYQALPADQRRVFRLLGMHPASDVAAPSVAAMAGLPLAEADRVLEALLDDNLVEQVVQGRYRQHDLLRAYARARAWIEDAPAARADAIGRVLEWYVAVTAAATAVIRRFPVPPFDDPPPDADPLPDVSTSERALAWLDAEYPNLRAVVDAAADGPRAARAIQMALLLEPYFVLRSRSHDWIHVQRRAVAAARRIGDDRAAAHAATSLGLGLFVLGENEPARRQMESALVRHRANADPRGEALTRNHLGSLYRRVGRHRDALASFRAALRIFRDLGDEHRIASTQSNVSVELHLLGRNEEAVRAGRDALDRQLRLGGRGEGALRTNLGLMYARIGRHDDAVEQCLAALALHRSEGSHPGEVNALTGLCYSYARLGRTELAVEAGTRALEMARRLVGEGEPLADALNTLADAYRMSGDLRAARAGYAEAAAVAARIDDVEQLDRARAGLATTGS